jgi:hypothetical protein
VGRGYPSVLLVVHPFVGQAISVLRITKERNTLLAFDMTESLLPSLLIVADFPDALTELGGISLLERWRRIARQIGFREATILSNSIEPIAAHVAKA